MTHSTLPRPKAKAAEPSTDAPQDANRLRRVQRSREEMLEQGPVLARSLTAAKESLRSIVDQLASREISRVVVLGCGDSWYVGLGVRDFYEQLLKLPTEGTQALDYALYQHASTNDRTLVIGISAGGNTAAVMEALARAQERGAFTIGVTNNPDTPITKKFDAAIHVSAKRVGWPTQSTTATMGVLDLLACELAARWHTTPIGEITATREEINRVPAQMDAALQTLDTPMQALAEELVEARFLLYTGAGPHFATAYIGAGKVRELCPIHAMALPLEEFHHYRTLKPQDPLFLIAPDATSHPRALDTAEVGRYDGGQIIALVPEDEREIAAVAKWTLRLPTVSRLLAPMLYSLPLHLFAYHFAMAKFERGLGYPGALPGAEMK